MSQNEKIYSKIDEAKEIIVGLCEKYPDVFWRINPDRVGVYGVENKERSKKCKKLCMLKAVKGVEKAVFEEANIPTRHIIDIYWADWNQWSYAFKQCVIARELLKISEDAGKVINFDCQDFKILVDVLGYDWDSNPDKILPNLIDDDVEFNLELRPGLEDEEVSFDDPSEEEKKDFASDTTKN